MYISKYLPSDEMILRKLTEGESAKRWCELLNKNVVPSGVHASGRFPKTLVKAGRAGTATDVSRAARSLLKKLGV